MSLKTLSLLTGSLFVVSLLVFFNENKRGTGLLEGSDYVKGLDVETIQKIVLHFDGEKKTALTRDGDHFILESHKSYPAASDKVNDLVYKIASIEVKEKVSAGADEEQLKQFELDGKSRKYFIELFDNDGKRTVAFRVGKSPKGKGHYLYKEGSEEVHLSLSSFWLNTSHKQFVDTNLLSLQEDEIEKLSLQTNTKIELERKDEEFAFSNPAHKKFKKEKAKEYVGNLSFLNFDDFFTPEEPEVRSLKFNREVRIQLKNNLVYQLSLAKRRDDHFARLSALVHELPEKVVVRQDDDKEKLQEIENMIKAQEVAQKVNREKSTWIYKIDKSTYENIVKTSKFFL